MFHCNNERTKINFRYPCIDGFFFSFVWLYSFSLFLLLRDNGRVVQNQHFTLINKFYVNFALKPLTNIIYPLMKAAKSFLHIYKVSISIVYAERKVKASQPKLNLLTCLNQNSSQRKTSKRQRSDIPLELFVHKVNVIAGYRAHPRHALPGRHGDRIYSIVPKTPDLNPIEKNIHEEKEKKNALNGIKSSLLNWHNDA